MDVKNVEIRPVKAFFILTFLITLLGLSIGVPVEYLFHGTIFGHSPGYAHSMIAMLACGAMCNLCYKTLKILIYIIYGYDLKEFLQK